MGIVIGIDLGTTNSCLSVLENGEYKVIENQEGARTTSSVVAFTEEGECLVGDSAKRQAVTNPTDTIYAVKRLIGRRFDDPETKKIIDDVPYKVVEGDNGDAWVEVQGKKMAPAEISSRILQKLKQAAENYFGEEVTEAVITVPAYFDDAQRKATKDAGTIAGLNVRRVVNEPTAAALSFGLDKKNGNEEDKTVIVYDLGGGTFDVSILEIADIDGERQFNVISTNGDTFLGGEDFDNRIIDYLAEEFSNSNNGFDLKKDQIALQRLKEAAEKAKKELSTMQQTSINIPYITADATGPKHLDIKLSRSKLESLIEDLVERTIEPCKQALKDADMEFSDIDEVLLVGGMTRMPMVRETVKKVFGKEPNKSVNPDEVVAAGASLQGGILSGDVKNALLVDVTPLSIGVAVKEAGISGIMDTLIKRNSPLPTKAEETYGVAKDNQENVEIVLYQGERKEVKDNKVLGKFILEIPAGAKVDETEIKVSLNINANGLLEVSAKEKTSGVENSISVKSDSGLTDDQINSMVKDAENNADKDKAMEEKIVVTATSDNLIKIIDKSTEQDYYTQASEDLRNGFNAAADGLKAAKETGNVAEMKTANEAMEKQIKTLNDVFTAAKEEKAKTAETDTVANANSADKTEAPKPQAGGNKPSQ